MEVVFNMEKEISEEENKKLLIQMLNDFHSFCESNRIKYYAGYGTLLGAIRHKGFIPWDDDVDVIVPRSDYNKLIQMFNKRESRFRIKNFNLDPKYPYNFAKVYDSRTKLVENLYHDYGMGIYMDVFPIDYWPKDDGILQTIQRLQKLAKVKSYRIGKSQGIKKNIALLLLKPLLSWLSLKKLVCKIDDLVERSEKDELFIGNISANVYGKKERMKSEWLNEKTVMKFENIEVNVPVSYDEVLTHLYGDYMTPPPIEEQVTHHSSKSYYV